MLVLSPVGCVWEKAVLETDNAPKNPGAPQENIHACDVFSVGGDMV